MTRPHVTHPPEPRPPGGAPTEKRHAALRLVLTLLAALASLAAAQGSWEPHGDLEVITYEVMPGETAKVHVEFDPGFDFDPEVRWGDGTVSFVDRFSWSGAELEHVYTSTGHMTVEFWLAGFGDAYLLDTDFIYVRPEPALDVDPPSVLVGEAVTATVTGGPEGGRLEWGDGAFEVLGGFEVEEYQHAYEEPGVYLMRDVSGSVLYVGKANSLRQRLRNYFTPKPAVDRRIASMIAKIASYDTILCANELEALVLEANLIKQYQPPYNILMRDDKEYPYIRVTLQEAFPRVMKAFRVGDDLEQGARYYGPWLAGDINRALKVLEAVFPLRTCSRDLPRDIGRERPCLNYHIGRCLAPCAGLISKEDYRAIIEIVDDEGRPVPPGQSGNVVATDLVNRAFPLIRYSGMGDIAGYRPGRCTCGLRALPLLDRIEGRKIDSILLPDNRIVHPYRLTLLVQDLPGVQKFQIRQETQDEILVLIVRDPAGAREASSAEDLPPYRELKKRLQDVLGGGMTVRLRFVDDIPRSENSHKYQTVVSLVHPPGRS